MDPVPNWTSKVLYTIALSSYTPGYDVTKSGLMDLLPALRAPGGLVPGKIESAAVDAAGNVWIVNDNDEVDTNSGETQLLNLDELL